MRRLYDCVGLLVARSHKRWEAVGVLLIALSAGLEFGLPAARESSPAFTPTKIGEWGLFVIGTMLLVFAKWFDGYQPKIPSTPTASTGIGNE
jgi:hypothetical protein